MKNNRKYKIMICTIFSIIELFIPFIVIKKMGYNFIFDKIIILTILNFFCFSNFFFDFKKLYDFIFKKRYIIALIIIMYSTIMCYHFSSLGVWNGVIQPNNNVNSSAPIFGNLRGIRADDFAVTTPTIFSQDSNNFKSVSNILMGRKENITLYPSLPSWHISILGNICNLPYLLLPLSNAFSLSWFLKLFLVFFSTLELCMIICKNKKLYAFVGAMLVTFSGANNWWGNIPIIAFGSLAVLMIYFFGKTNKRLSKLLYSILFGLIGANYFLVLYPAWMVPFAYVYFALAIWIIVDNRNKYRWSDLLYLFIPLIIFLIIVVPTFVDSKKVYDMVSNTVYPGYRFSSGGKDYEKLFVYYLGIFLPFKDFFNPCEFSNFISLYPLPIILSIYYTIKNKIKHKKCDFLLIILTILAVLLSFWNYFKIPKIVAKITLLSFSTESRCQLVVGYLCVLILLRLIAVYECNIKLNIKKVVFSVIASILCFSIGIFIVNNILDEFLTKKMMLIDFIIFVPLFIFLIINSCKLNKILAVILILLTFLSGVSVNPLSKGIDVFYKKPVAIEIKNIVRKKPFSRWLVVHSNYVVPNYLIANGAITINSTNYYPNMNLWKKFDKNGENDFIYNRYAHVLVNFTNESTKFDLVSGDSFRIYLNIKDLNKFNIDYIYSSEDISDYVLRCTKKIYDEDNAYIYKVNKNCW